VEKITGLKETVKGKVTHNPELAAKGHDRMTGELKHKELEEDAVRFPVYQPFKELSCGIIESRPIRESGGEEAEA
jgi:hypothetical protein